MSMTSYSRVDSFGSFRGIRPKYNERAFRQLEDDYLEDPEEFDEEEDEEEEDGDED